MSSSQVATQPCQPVSRPSIAASSASHPPGHRALFHHFTVALAYVGLSLTYASSKHAMLSNGSR